MKRFASVIALLLLCISLSACAGREHTVSHGPYRSTVDIGYYVYFVPEEQEFLYYYKDVEVGDGIHGTYEIQNGKVICTAGDAIVVFKIIDSDTVRFVESQSRNLEDSPITNGTEFHLDPPQ